MRGVIPACKQFPKRRDGRVCEVVICTSLLKVCLRVAAPVYKTSLAFVVFTPQPIYLSKLIISSENCCHSNANICYCVPVSTQPTTHTAILGPLGWSVLMKAVEVEICLSQPGWLWGTVFTSCFWSRILPVFSLILSGPVFGFSFFLSSDSYFLFLAIPLPVFSPVVLSYYLFLILLLVFNIWRCVKTVLSVLSMR
jgi:hypothetical protein